MGYWREDAFGNDSACDWLASFLQQPGLDFIRLTFEKVTAQHDFLDSDDASEGLAAGEVLARLKGNWGERDAYSEEVDQWIESNPCLISSELIELAIAAIERILGPESELAEIWDSDGFNDTWHNHVEDLRQRILN